MHPRSRTLSCSLGRSQALQRSLVLLPGFLAAVLALVVPAPAHASAELQPIGEPFAVGAPLTEELKAPTVEPKPASLITQTTATLNGTVDPNGAAIEECTFEYGTTTAYGKTAPCNPTGGSGTSPEPVSAAIASLTPNTTYDFRVVAKNAGGTEKGGNETFKTLEEPPPAPPTIELTAPSPAAQTGQPSSPSVSAKSSPTPVQTGPPAPVLAHSLVLAPVTGQVSIRLPGARRFISLSAARQVPVRTVVETTYGEVSVTAATPRRSHETGDFFDGQFMLTQGRKGRVMATLTGGDFGVCPRPVKAASAELAHTSSGHAVSAEHLVRRLWAEVRGDFATTGNYATGVVTGAQWLTEDLCDGTLILTTRNRVEITDLVRHRRIEAVAGDIYIAKAG
jgi:hypothetical protein